MDALAMPPVDGNAVLREWMKPQRYIAVGAPRTRTEHPERWTAANTIGGADAWSGETAFVWDDNHSDNLIFTVRMVNGQLVFLPGRRSGGTF